MTNHTKEHTARKLVKAHAAVEPGMLRVVRLRAAREQEDQPEEPVKLLEVNESSIAAGVLPLFFGADPDAGIYFPCVIVEVTPDEYASILQGRLTLPAGWQFAETLFERDTVTAEG